MGNRMIKKLIMKFKKRNLPQKQLVVLRNGYYEYEYNVDVQNGIYRCRRRRIGNNDWVFDSGLSCKDGYYRTIRKQPEIR